MLGVALVLFELKQGHFQVIQGRKSGEIEVAEGACSPLPLLLVERAVTQPSTPIVRDYGDGTVLVYALGREVRKAAKRAQILAEVRA